MRKRVVIRASKDAKRRVNIKCASTAEMLDAFENKLAEVENIEFSTDVNASSDTFSEVDRTVKILPGDEDVMFEDIGGGFGDESNKIYTLADLEEWWNRDCNSDPSFFNYDSFDEWLEDTKRNGYLKELY